MSLVHVISAWLYTMWFINIAVWSYAILTMYKIIRCLSSMIRNLGKNWRLYDMQILQLFSAICVLVMFLSADVWAMSYYTKHALAPLEYFFYAFDTAVIYHLSSELERIEYFNSNLKK